MSGEPAIIGGFHTIGDGGGGTLVFDPASTLPPDGGTVIRPSFVTAGQPGRYIRLNSGPNDARWFGASGNGTTDDHAALVAALAASDHVRLSGTHRIASDLAIPTGKVLHFDQGGQLAPDAGKVVFLAGAIAAPPVQIFSGAGVIYSAARERSKVDRIFPQWWGAVGDGVHDDTAAIQSAINFAASCGGGTIVLLPGVYAVSSPVEIRSDVAGDYARNIRLVAMRVRGGGGFADTSIGASVSMPAVLRLWSTQCEVRGISFGPLVATAIVGTCIDATVAPGAGTGGSTELRIIKCSFGGATYGITIGDKAGAVDWPNNCDFYTIDDCFFNALGDSCIYIPNQTRQSFSHRITKCKFLNTPVGIKLWGGSFRVEDCAFAIISVACVQVVGSRISDTLVFEHCNAETCYRFFEDTVGNSGAQAIMIIGGRLDASDGALAPDGLYIKIWRTGPLTLLGVSFPANPIGNFKISVSGQVQASADLSGNTLVAIGCSFGVADPFVDPTGASHRIVLGCDGAASGPYLSIHDQIGRQTGPQIPLVLSRIPESSGTAAPTTGDHSLGEIVRNTAPASGGYIGWVCIAAGTPGTWKPYGLIS